jgi:CO/xanthine dehydrogenase FAD-binding subunit
MLAVMAKDVGAVQIQTRGTLAGNIASASPAADGVPALMALDANVTLASVSGTRTVPLDGFFTAYRKTVMRPDELILDVDFRVPHRKALVKWRKVGTRLAQAISKVALASVIEIEGGTVKHARFGMASVAAVTHPLPSVRKYLEGRAVGAIVASELDAAVAADIKPIDDVRSTGEYRLHVAKALVRRALEPA